MRERRETNSFASSFGWIVSLYRRMSLASFESTSSWNSFFKHHESSPPETIEKKYNDIYPCLDGINRTEEEDNDNLSVNFKDDNSFSITNYNQRLDVELKYLHNVRMVRFNRVHCIKLSDILYTLTNIDENTSLTISRQHHQKQQSTNAVLTFSNKSYRIIGNCTSQMVKLAIKIVKQIDQHDNIISSYQTTSRRPYIISHAMSINRKTSTKKKRCCLRIKTYWFKH